MRLRARASVNPAHGRGPARRALALWALLALAAHAAGAAKSIVFTHVPDIGQATDKVLSGRVHGIDPATARIALYLLVDEAWWTKPSFGQPLTPIAADGSWSATIAPVASDTSATQIAALLVPAGFVPPQVDGAPWLPDVITQSALASTDAIRPDPARRNFHWSGIDWWVRDSGGERHDPRAHLHRAPRQALRHRYFLHACRRLMDIRGHRSVRLRRDHHHRPPRSRRGPTHLLPRPHPAAAVTP